MVKMGKIGRDGKDGVTGATGNGIASITKTGTSGLVDTYTVTYTNGDTDIFTVTNGRDGTNGTNGQDGHTPEKGVDYFTNAEIQEIEEDILGQVSSTPQVFYWDGATDQTGLDFWNVVYQASKKTDLMVFRYINSRWIAYFFRKNQNFAANVQATPYIKNNTRTDTTDFTFGYNTISFTISNDVITAINKNDTSTMLSYIDTSNNYSSPYTPRYNGSPATKKYVDDSISNAISGLSSTLSSIEGVVG